MKVFNARFSLLTAALFGVILFNGIVMQASSVAVTAGQPVTLTITADGTDPFSYQWYKDGIVLTGATSSTFTLSNFQAADAGTYSALVSNSAGSTTTDDAGLTLAVANVAPTFTTQPVGQTVTAGGSVTFTVAVTGIPAPTFQWRKSGVNITGATSSSYVLPSVSISDADSYTVVATNSVGATTSNTATLTVNPAPSAPVFTTQPSSQTVTAGVSVTFSAAANGVPSPTFQWKKNGANITGATSTFYTLSSVTTADIGSYTAVATNSVSAVSSNTAVLAVNAATVAPTISTHPASQTVTAGGSATFTVVANGTPAPNYQWRRNGANITGANNASYTITNVTVSNAATYTVVVSNSAGSITSNGALLTIYSSPAFTLQPASQTVTTGGAVTFTATASGTPAPAYQWKKGGAAIAGATSGSYTIASVATGSAGSYTVVATNSVGTATSNTATLTVNPAPAAPTFTIQPSNQTVMGGNPVTFVAAATGTPTPTFQWKKDGIAIPGATGATYIIPSAAITDEAIYTVVASNTVNTATSNPATLSVVVAPTNVVVTLTIK